MGNQELLDCFSEYAPLKARHAYGPQGHRGMSVLIFEASVPGYLEAVRLYKHFREQGRDREAWNRCRNPFVPGGKRQLYGYLASMEDLNIFNRHSAGPFPSHLISHFQSYMSIYSSYFDIYYDLENENFTYLFQFRRGALRCPCP